MTFLARMAEASRLRVRGVWVRTRDENRLLDAY